MIPAVLLIALIVDLTILVALLNVMGVGPHVARIRSPLLRVPLWGTWFPMLLWVHFCDAVVFKQSLLPAWFTRELWQSHWSMYEMGLRGVYVNMPWGSSL